MLIQVTTGTGIGPTEMAAFDQALVNAGIANLNLIYLSSVLPPQSKVVEISDSLPKIDGVWGDRLYVVMAQYRASKKGHEAWAGIGWIQDEQTGAGLLTEHEGTSEAQVRQDITNTLQALALNRSQHFGPIHMAVRGTKCADAPVCALVTAIFETAPWRAAL
jgi:arginine decarboxylase